MKVTRREFLKISGAAVAALPVLGFDAKPAMAEAEDSGLKILSQYPPFALIAGVAVV